MQAPLHSQILATDAIDALNDLAGYDTHWVDSPEERSGIGKILAAN